MSTKKIARKLFDLCSTFACLSVVLAFSTPLIAQPGDLNATFNPSTNILESVCMQNDGYPSNGLPAGFALRSTLVTDSMFVIDTNTIQSISSVDSACEDWATFSFNFAGSISEIVFHYHNVSVIGAGVGFSLDLESYAPNITNQFPIDVREIRYALSSVDLTMGSSVSISLPSEYVSGNAFSSLSLVDASGNPLVGVAYSITGTTLTISSGNVGTQQLALIGTTDSGDAFIDRFSIVVTEQNESNDYGELPATAGAISVGDSISSEIETPNDRDWFAVSLQAGITYQIDLEGSPTSAGTLADTFLRGIYDASGNLLSNTSNDDGGDFTNSQVQFTPSTTGTYYISAGAFASDTGTYRLSISDFVGSNVGDDYGERPGTAGAISVGDSITGDIEEANDRDWFVVNLLAGITYQIDLEGSPTSAGTLADTYLRGIYDANGNLLSNTSNDDGGVSSNSQVQFTPSYNGTHYISAGAFSSNTGTYRLSINDLGAGSGDDPPGTPPVTSGPIQQFALGGRYGCVLVEGGDVFCWGISSGIASNNGNSTYEVEKVSGLSGIQMVEVSDDSQGTACAIDSSSNVQCWGYGRWGILGNHLSQGEIISSPTTVDYFGTAIDIAVGHSHACMVLSNGGVTCWGADLGGAIGDGSASTPEGYGPVALAGITNAEKIDSYQFKTCVLHSTGQVSCWGDGQNEPVLVEGISNAIDVKAGNGFACALVQGGTVKCWGEGDDYWQLGGSSQASSDTPVTVIGIDNATSIAVGHRHSCARLADGRVKCWGDNSLGQLGTGFAGSPTQAVEMIGVSDASDVSVSGDSSTVGTTGLLQNGNLHLTGTSSGPQTDANPSGVSGFEQIFFELDLVLPSGGSPGTRNWLHQEMLITRNCPVTNIPWSAPIPPTNSDYCQSVYIDYAEVFSCNIVERFNEVQLEYNRCRELDLGPTN